MSSEEQVFLRIFSQLLSTVSELRILHSYVNITTATSKAEEKHTSNAQGQRRVQRR